MLKFPSREMCIKNILYEILLIYNINKVIILLVLLFLDNIVSPNYIGIINLIYYNILPFIPTTTKNKYI